MSPLAHKDVMNNKEEVVLRSILQSYREDTQPFYTRWPFRIIEFVLLVCAFAVARALLEPGAELPWLGLLLGTATGVAIGVFSLLRASHSCIPYIKPFIDLDGIKRKLGESE